jgi:predicted transposase YbfD/YdcC
LPKKTVNAIKETGNQYFIQVKKNQKMLYAFFLSFLESTALASSEYKTIERKNGNEVIRYTQVINMSAEEKLKQKWSNLKTGIIVERHFYCKEVLVKKENSFFISDISCNAEQSNKIVREHWGIENKIHRVKDVLHNEDKNRIKCRTGAVSCSVFSSIAINLHYKSACQSVAKNQIKFGANISLPITLLRS